MYGERLCEACLPKQPRPRRVLLNFQQDHSGWSASFLAEDAQTRLSRRYHLRSLESLRDLVRRTHSEPGTLEELNNSVERWGRGSVYLRLTEAEYRRLRL